MMTDINRESGLTEWTSITVAEVSMSPYAVNTLFECLAKSDKIAEGGYLSIKFKHWLALGASLDTEVLQMLADSAPNAIEFEYDQEGNPRVIEALTSDNQF